jgi:hypothetical protein
MKVEADWKRYEDNEFLWRSKIEERNRNDKI